VGKWREWFWMREREEGFWERARREERARTSFRSPLSPSSHLVLAAHVPDREGDVLVLDRLHVEAWEGKKGKGEGGAREGGVRGARGERERATDSETEKEEKERVSSPRRPSHLLPLSLTNRGDGRHDLAQLQLIQDGGLTRGVEPDLRGERRREQRERS